MHLACAMATGSVQGKRAWSRMTRAIRRMFTGANILVALAISIALLVAFPTRAFAADISSDVVTSLTASETSVETQQSTTFTLTFSENDSGGNLVHDIQSGDIITVSWPTIRHTSSLGFILVGYASTFDLTFIPEGSSTAVTIGQVVVTGENATITFNDNVEGYDDVNGSVQFMTEVQSPTAIESGLTDTIDVTSGGQTATLSVTQPDSTDSPFYEDMFLNKGSNYYNDDPSTHTIEWNIDANTWFFDDLNGTVTITDTLSQPALDAPEFEAAYVYYQDEDDSSISHELVSYTSQDEFESALGATFSYNSTNRTLTITIPSSSLTSFSYNGSTQPIMVEIYFTTPWDPNSQVGAVIVNAAYAYFYTDMGGNPTETAIDSADTLLWARQTIQATAVVEGTTVPIEGVTFRVYKLTGRDGERISGWYENEDGTMSDYVDITTGADGVATLEGLRVGDYFEVEEVSAPDWVVLSQDTLVQDVWATSITKTFENAIVSGDITATTDWLASDGSTTDTSTHPTIYLQLYRSVDGGDPIAVDGAAIMELADGTTSATWEDLPLYDTSGNKYTYSVKEVDADGNDYVPDGYTKEESGLTVTNTKITSTKTASTKTASGSVTPAPIPDTGDQSFLPIGTTFMVTASVLGVALIMRRKMEKQL